MGHWLQGSPQTCPVHHWLPTQSIVTIPTCFSQWTPSQPSCPARGDRLLIHGSTHESSRFKCMGNCSTCIAIYSTFYQLPLTLISDMKTKEEELQTINKTYCTNYSLYSCIICLTPICREKVSLLEELAELFTAKDNFFMSRDLLSKVSYNSGCLIH